MFTHRTRTNRSGIKMRAGYTSARDKIGEANRITSRTPLGIVAMWQDHRALCPIPPGEAANLNRLVILRRKPLFFYLKLKILIFISKNFQRLVCKNQSTPHNKKPKKSPSRNIFISLAHLLPHTLISYRF